MAPAAPAGDTQPMHLEAVRNMVDPAMIQKLLAETVIQEKASPAALAAFALTVVKSGARNFYSQALEEELEQMLSRREARKRNICSDCSPK